VSGPSNQDKPIALKTGYGQFHYSDNSNSTLPDNYTALISHKESHAVLPLAHYQLQRIHIDAATMPLGYDPGKTEYEVYPEYQQGFIFKAGGEPGVIVDGVIKDTQGNIVSFKGGQWTPMNEQDKAIAFFTNKVGRFRLVSVPPGSYKLELFDYPDMEVVEVIVPGKNGTIHDIGEISISSPVITELP